MEEWSEKYYPSLTPEQHEANNAWFKQRLSLLKSTGILGVPDLGKVFNAQGEEISNLTKETLE